MFGSPETTTGGNALKFYASMRLDVRRIDASEAVEGPRLFGRGDSGSGSIASMLTWPLYARPDLTALITDHLAAT